MNPRRKKITSLILPALWLIFCAGILIFFLTSRYLPVKEYQLVSKEPTVYKTNNNSGGLMPSEENTPALTTMAQDKSDSINFLLLGAAGEGNDAPDLTDTIILARWDKTQQRIFLFSFPRDLLVQLPRTSNYTKLNALYAYDKKNAGHEFDGIKSTVEKISGLKIDHYIFADLTAVEKIVDILGGVNVMVKKDILDTQFPGPNHSYETFEIKAGWRYLDGQTALKYLRTRHSAGGDFDRVERQQEVLQALKQKALALKPWNVIQLFELYTTLSKNIKTDLSLWRIKNYWDDARAISQDNLIKTEINQKNLLQTRQINLGGETASVLEPKSGVENYREIREYIQKVINDE